MMRSQPLVFALVSSMEISGVFRDSSVGMPQLGYNIYNIGYEYSRTFELHLQPCFTPYISTYVD